MYVGLKGMSKQSELITCKSYQYNNFRVYRNECSSRLRRKVAYRESFNNIELRIKNHSFTHSLYMYIQNVMLIFNLSSLTHAHTFIQYITN